MRTDLFCMLFLIAAISSTNSVFSQEDFSVKSSHFKNAVHGTLGFVGLGGTINAGYSRFIGETNYKFFTSYWIGIDVGAIAIWEDSWRYMNIDLTALTGSGKNHFELSVGLVRLYDFYYEDITYYPCGSLGYRFQKPNRGFFFKTGIGYPEFLHAGIGTRF
jgi:hypothetical protein